MITGLVVLIVLQLLSVTATILMVGKPRTPTTPGIATVSVFISMCIVAFYVALIYTLDGIHG